MVADGRSGTASHGDAIAGGDVGVGGIEVDLSGATGCQNRRARHEALHLVTGTVEHVGAPASRLTPARRRDIVHVTARSDPDSLERSVVLEETRQRVCSIERWMAMMPAEIKKQLPASDEALRKRLAVSEAQVRAANWHSDIPLIVLTHGIRSPDDYGISSMAATGEQLRLEMQEALARLSSRSKHILAEKSGHYIQRDQPELVIDAIRQVVEATRIQSRKSF